MDRVPAAHLAPPLAVVNSLAARVRIMEKKKNLADSDDLVSRILLVARQSHDLIDTHLGHHAHSEKAAVRLAPRRRAISA